MIYIDNTEIFGWEAAIRGMRNPKNSWDLSDSVFCMGAVSIGDKDLKLMKTLSRAGNDHGKFMRMIHVQFDLTAPLYWWKEFDTYKIGTVADSCSTMHKIHAKKFERSDFSFDHLDGFALAAMDDVIHLLNSYRIDFLETKNKEDWWQMIQMLPASYNQKRTIDLNYAVLKNMYKSRKDHKLDEWHIFCDWIEDLPYSELITGKDENNG